MTHGAIPGVPVGAHFNNRRSLYVAGIHRDIRRGICGSSVPGLGAESIVLSGGYEDDIDLGALVYYTGQGGRDSNGIQVADQQMAGLNASLARNVDSGERVRLVRSTLNGFRYDGLYLVEDAWQAPGLRGHLICRYRLRSETVGEGPMPANGQLTPQLPQAPPKSASRRETTHYRLVRDGKVPAAVKALYDFTCQICGERVLTAAGPYAEGAHLVPLGGGQDGDDHLSNVLCLCPNDHVRFDHGSLAISDDLRIIDRTGNDLGLLHVHPDHGLALDNIRRHRKLLGFA